MSSAYSSTLQTPGPHGEYNRYNASALRTSPPYPTAYPTLPKTLPYTTLNSTLPFHYYIIFGCSQTHRELADI